MPNRIAVYGHRGWVGSAIVRSLSESPAVVKVLYRPGSNAQGLPSNVTAVQVDITDEEALVAALRDVDILISLVGHSAIEFQHNLIRAIPKTNVQLFVPSDLAVRYSGQGLGIELINAKIKVEEAAERLGVPITVVLTGNFAEFALDTPAMGVDHRHNRIIFTGNSASQPLNLCTREYVAAAFASIFSTTLIPQLQNRTLSLSELKPTGDEIAQALTQRFGATPAKFTVPLGEVTCRVDAMIEANNPLALAWYTRKNWGNGDQLKFLGSDIWEVDGYDNKSIEDLVVAGKLGEYRAMPEQITSIFESEFLNCR
ncbi:NAD(P)-binding protein [Aspergillus violaceofuscus CBS 115571]|uniref:NAD(P)-binding protein n=1 Tax=Aspergillus violaceofuscus (strain CBS 115571) TaxID=1450538 RepID=A0A2V5H3R8_ASPV1|nr:NAD(P)-binding protein [Aspergillus violaceofuscus CBS 115571]